MAGPAPFRLGTLRVQSQGGEPVIVNCTNCNAENAAGRRFCDQCGSSLAAACLECGAHNRPEARFCGDCGTALAGGTPGAPNAADPASAPPPAGESAGAGGATTALSTSGAERRLVSVLFADLVAFTEYSDGRDPEIVRDTLSRYFDATRTVIERHGGRVEKFIGDAVMAAWGAPKANEDDAERAVRAALEVIHAVTDLDEGLRARVAVLTGQAAVTLGATDQGMVAGDMVNTAARLQGVAPPNTVLVGEATMQAASDAIAFEPVGEQQLKGKEAPVVAWRAVRVISDRSGRSRSEGLEPPFVGREVELRLLKDTLHQTAEEMRPRLISITGPAGIGKSRLAWELLKYVDGLVQDIYWHHGRAPSYGEGVTFWALGEMVRRRSGLVESDDEATTRERIHTTVEEYLERPEDRQLVEPALLTLLGLEPQPPGGRDMLFAAWRIFFERIASRGTTVLLFEDLQWADAGQLDFIDHVMEWSREVPLLIITLARPELLETRPGWGTSARSFNAMGLEPLTKSNMRDLLRGLVPTLPRPVVDEVTDRADGIPLYAVETVRMLAADGRLEQAENGTFSPTGELGELAIPDSLRALVGSRLDALDPADRALLQNAAVLGKTFATPALADIADMPEPEVEQRLRSLVKREVLEISVDPRSPERGQFGFVQSVIREVAYETLSRRDRRARHLAAARYFEQTEDEELAGVLSVHYRAALEASDEGPEAEALQVQARIALRAAADRAATLGSSAQALGYLDSALELTHEPADLAPLMELAARAADQDGQELRAVELGKASVSAFEAAGDEAGAARATVQLSQIMIDAGFSEDVLVLLPDAIERYDSDELGPARARMLSNLSRAQFRLGHEGESVQIADQALTVAERLSLNDVIAEALLNRASALASHRVVEPTILLRAAIDLAHESGQITTEIRARSNLAVTLSVTDLPGAIRLWTEVAEDARRSGTRIHVEWAVGSQAWGLTEQGEDWDAGLAYIQEHIPEMRTDAGLVLHGSAELLHLFRGEEEDEARERAAREASFTDETARGEYADWFVFHPGWKALLQGRFDEAGRIFDEVLPLLGQRRWVSLQGMVLAAAWARDRSAAVVAHDTYRDEGMAGGVNRGVLHLAEGSVLALSGEREAARERLTTAVDIIRSAGWHWWVALAQTTALYLMPDEPLFADWESEARARFELLGARPMLERLDEAVALREKATTT